MNCGGRSMFLILKRYIVVLTHHFDFPSRYLLRTPTQTSRNCATMHGAGSLPHQEACSWLEKLGPTRFFFRRLSSNEEIMVQYISIARSIDTWRSYSLLLTSIAHWYTNHEPCQVQQDSSFNTCGNYPLQRTHSSRIPPGSQGCWVFESTNLYRLRCARQRCKHVDIQRRRTWP